MNILSFDAESNGLHGEAFAIGAVVVDRSGREVNSFAARCPVSADVDPWVAENILPALSDLQPTHTTAREMRDAFWAWLQAHKARCLVVADCGWPVEAGLLSACVGDDPSRAFAGPYPLHEVATLLLAAGMDPLATYDELCPPCAWPKHDPRRDALQSAACAVAALNKIGGSP